MLFTDGITEATDENETEFGLDGLIESWNRQTLVPVEASRGILEDVRLFTNDSPLEDDQTMMLLHRPG